MPLVFAEHQRAITQDCQNTRALPSDVAATKLLWLALRNITVDWGNANRDWKEAMNQFAMLYEHRSTRSHLKVQSNARPIGRGIIGPTHKNPDSPLLLV